MVGLSLEAVLMPSTCVLYAILQINTFSIPFRHIIPELSFITHITQYLQTLTVSLPVLPLTLVEFISDQVAHHTETFDFMTTEFSLINSDNIEEESALSMRDTVHHLSDVG